MKREREKKTESPEDAAMNSEKKKEPAASFYTLVLAGLQKTFCLEEEGERTETPLPPFLALQSRKRG